MKMYPLLFEPVYQHYLWGGHRIIDTFQREGKPGIYAESWEISDRPEGMSIISNGPLAGRSLSDVLHEANSALLGDVQSDHFPLLIKILDAKKTLSVQVHPNDETAKRHGGEAKTEMWYVLDAEPGACVYAGYKPGMDEERFRQAVAEGTLENELRMVPVKTGDAVFMPGGRVHAIGAGCLMLEVQQNSNTTYRIYDWGRVDAEGNARELHIDQAVQVTRWHDEAPVIVPAHKLECAGDNENWLILECEYFRMDKLILSAPHPVQHSGASFHALFCAQGAVQLSWDTGEVELQAGVSCLIPAVVNDYHLKPDQPQSIVLRTMVGDE